MGGNRQSEPTDEDLGEYARLFDRGESDTVLDGESPDWEQLAEQYLEEGSLSTDANLFAATPQRKVLNLDSVDPRPRIVDAMRRIWGYDTLRPLQEDAIAAGLEGRDSVVVMPTGGGKSLCYQIPPLILGRTDVVVSPLISLMKDQVDGLVANGYPAVAIHSGMEADQRRLAMDQLRSGTCRLVFVAPERLCQGSFLNTIRELGVHHFAIDEAHCISHWGHDFRPEYRQLERLKEIIPGASVHAYTATATERVRDDISQQLNLENPNVLVGSFDRPNLVYRIVQKQDLDKQVLEVLERHRDEALIIYCLSRQDTEDMAAKLRSEGYDAAFYHAGMNPETRRRTQEAFAREQLNIICATVAFGMGIDRSDVRCVIHVGVPKSVEHYQQEAGRAGRDGLEAECIMFYSGADIPRWQNVMERSARESNAPPESIEAGVELLQQVRKLCAPNRCRHAFLTEYFGQRYVPRSEKGCDACDVCLGENEQLVEATVHAQKILSCVARVRERFGMGHVVDVLRGSVSDRIKSSRHDELSTYGLLAEIPKNVLTNQIYQLVDQGLLERTTGRYPRLQLNAASWEVLRGERDVKLIPVRVTQVHRTRVEEESWEGVDRQLFEQLRRVRASLAESRGVPPYVIFNDKSLRDMAAKKPKDAVAFLQIHGVGERKLADLGETFLDAIATFEN